MKRKVIGISNIINRVESYNGEVIIESSPGEGLQIRDQDTALINFAGWPMCMIR